MNRKNIKLGILVMLLCGLIGCSKNVKNGDLVLYTIETVGVEVGYELRDSFVWTDQVQIYYDAVMAGNLTPDMVQLAEAFLKEQTHPVIANRIIRLAILCGFTVEPDGVLTGVENVDLQHLQAAIRGFKQGLEIQG